MLFKKRHARERAAKEAEAKKIADKKFNQSSRAFAEEITKMHKEFKQHYPTNYVAKMHPFVNSINAYRKKNNIADPIAAAMGLITKSTPRRHVISYYAAAAEMLNNIKPEPNGKEGTR